MNRRVIKNLLLACVVIFFCGIFAGPLGIAPRSLASGKYSIDLLADSSCPLNGRPNQLHWNATISTKGRETWTLATDDGLRFTGGESAMNGIQFFSETGDALSISKPTSDGKATSIYILKGQESACIPRYRGTIAAIP